MRMWHFAGRNAREILRDPLSYLFCLGLPVVLMTALHLLFYKPEVPWFGVEVLAPGIAVFGFTFVSLYMALLVSKDRASAFLTRLYTTPMTTVDFVVGYALPGLVIGLGQAAACWLTAAILAAVKGGSFPLLPAVAATLAAVPILLLCIAMGILIGCTFSDKAAPGIASAIISAAGFLSGAWMPVETSPVLEKVCGALPFYPAVQAVRSALAGTGGWDSLVKPLLVVAAYALPLGAAAVLAFARGMTRDK